MKARFGIVASRFNEEVTERLLASCLRTLWEAGAAASRVRVVRVPGAFEIPWAAQELARSGRFSALICLGCILQGRTPQNDHIARSVVSSLQDLSLRTRTPVALGVITPKTWKQALARARGPLDRGREAALAALEMSRLKGRL